MFNITERITYLEKKTAEMQAFLESAPAGSLNCKLTRGKFRYYIHENGIQTYLPSSKSDIINKLAKKKMFKSVLMSAKKELAALKQYKANSGLFEKTINRFYENNPGCAGIIRPGGWSYENRINSKVTAWQQEEYIRNPYYCEGLIHNTLRGEKVRSKSEACIADILYLAGIPYRYECQLVVNGETFYPDFVIMDPSTGKIYIWEHFGLMDDRDYYLRTVHKISAYAAEGYLPEKNFIITYEDENDPFTTVQAAEKVSHYFHRNVSSMLIR